MEAARAAGGRGLQVQRWGVLPLVLPELVGFWLYRFEINIRAGAVLGVVGAGGIGFLLDQTIKFGRFPQAGMAIIVVVVATILVDGLSGRVRRRIIEGADAKVAPEAESRSSTPPWLAHELALQAARSRSPRGRGGRASRPGRASLDRLTRS